MKSTLLLLAFSIYTTANAQKFSITSTANMNTAAGEQVGKFKNAYGMGAGIEMAFRKGCPLKLFFNADAGANGIKTMPYEFEFGNLITKTQIDYTSYVFELNTGLRYVFAENKKLKPYTGVSIGMLTYSTDYVIEDPEDRSGCRALESKKILSDRAFIGKFEGGVRYTSSWNAEIHRNISFDIGFSYKRGTTAEYMRLSNDHHGEGADYSVKFENANNEVHEHAIGKIYNTPVNQFGFRIGVVIPLSSVHSR